ncbi:MAG: hypothetical protein ACFFFH_18535, partial [Candidatus Thorarchaeota archaeon]
MIENRYKEVRMLLSENRIETAEKIYTELADSAERFSKEDKFWFKLLTSEIKRKKENLQLALDDIEDAFLLSKKIKLDNAQKSSLHGRMAIIQYGLKNYAKAASFFRQTLSFLSDDLGR